MFLKILDIDFWLYGRFRPKVGPPNLALWALNLNYQSVPRNYVSFQKVISMEKPSWTPFLIWACVCDQLIVLQLFSLSIFDLNYHLAWFPKLFINKILHFHVHFLYWKRKRKAICVNNSFVYWKSLFVLCIFWKEQDLFQSDKKIFWANKITLEKQSNGLYNLAHHNHLEAKIKKKLLRKKALGTRSSQSWRLGWY